MCHQSLTYNRDIAFQDIALPIMYEDIRIQSSHQLQRLAATLTDDPSHTAASLIRSISVPALLDAFLGDEIMQEYITLYNELHLIFHVVSRLESITIQANMQTSILVSFSRSSPTTLRYMDIIVHNLSDIKPLTYLQALTELRIGFDPVDYVDKREVPYWPLRLPKLVLFDFRQRRGRSSDDHIKWIGASQFNRACELRLQLSTMQAVQSLSLLPLFTYHNPKSVLIRGRVGLLHPLLACTNKIHFMEYVPSPDLFSTATRLPESIHICPDLQTGDDHTQLLAIMEALASRSISDTDRTRIHLYLDPTNFKFKWQPEGAVSNYEAQFIVRMLQYAGRLSALGITVLDSGGQRFALQSGEMV
jgi:hypothetical protein